MIIEYLKISGDTAGVEWQVPVLRFAGSDPNASRVYLQAALHADELPGTAVLHFLSEMLRGFEQQGLIAGNITIVPSANPIGADQKLFSMNQGRFEFGGRENFNRNFPLISYDDRQSLYENSEHLKAVDRLKANLLAMALEADIVLDLHCDSEALLYAYVCDEFWPGSKDLATAMGLDAVFIADGESSAFDEAVSYAWRHCSEPKSDQRLASTLEYRGERDVSKELAFKDAKGLIEFFKYRGIIAQKPAGDVDWNGVVAPLDDIEVIRAEVSGTVLFHKACGAQVEEGVLLATILTTPGQDKKQYECFAPQSGLIVSRAVQRFVHVQDQLMKIAGDKPSKTKRKPGALEQ